MGIGHICEGLAEQQNGGLQTLVLWNTQLTSHGVGYLANALVSWLLFLGTSNPYWFLYTTEHLVLNFTVL